MRLKRVVRKALIPKGYDHLAVLFRQRLRAETGTPPNLDPEWFREALASGVGADISSIAHCELRSYKNPSVYRLWVRFRGRRVRTFVFKDVRLDPESYPAISGFPGKPGLPEWILLSTAEGAIEAYLPRVYLAREVKTDQHYQYVLQDLAWKHVDVGKDDVGQAVRNLDAVHRALASWERAVGHVALIDFGPGSADAVWTYVERALKRYADVDNGEAAREFMRRWDDVLEAFYAPLPLVKTAPARLLHGDYNRRNIFLRQGDRSRMKLIDWEWMGIGPPHADLASILKGSPWDLQRALVAEFLRTEVSIPPDSHWLVYLWCRLERSLVDASLHANQDAAGIGQAATDVAWNLAKANEVLAMITGVGK